VLTATIKDAFELYHKAIEKEAKTSLLGGPALPALGHAVSGAAGSVISTTITYPLALIVTRLQVQRQLRKLGYAPGDDEYRSIFDAAEKIYTKEGGISAFFSGCGQDSVKTVIDSFLFFLAYNFVKDTRLRKTGTKRLPIHEELGVGMLAGAFSRLFTTPMGNIVTRKQTAAMIAAKTGNSNNAPSTSVKAIAAQIREEKGIIGFWSGYSATLVLTLNPALTFLFHETLLRMTVRRERRNSPGPRTTFIIAALSKAIASCITYPFSLAKSRSQVSAKAPTPVKKVKISEGDSVEETSRKAAVNIRQYTVFEMLIRIAREEGFAALYQGLEGEVLKGFFSHGLTMLLKERIHKVVIRLYYAVLRLLRRYPTPEDAAKVVVVAGTKVVKKAQSVGIQSQEKVEEVVGAMHDLYQYAKESHMDILDEYIPFDDDD
jgi:Mitochondrial carrier protein